MVVVEVVRTSSKYVRMGGDGPGEDRTKFDVERRTLHSDTFDKAANSRCRRSVVLQNLQLPLCGKESQYVVPHSFFGVFGAPTAAKNIPCTHHMAYLVPGISFDTSHIITNTSRHASLSYT